MNPGDCVVHRAVDHRRFFVRPMVLIARKGDQCEVEFFDNEGKLSREWMHEAALRVVPNHALRIAVAMVPVAAVVGIIAGIIIGRMWQ